VLPHDSQNCCPDNNCYFYPQGLLTFGMGWFNRDRPDEVLASILEHLVETIQGQEPTESNPSVELLGRLAEVERRLELLTLGLAEGIERVERSERRVRQTIASAKRRFEAEGYVDPGLEAEAAALPQADGDRGPEEEVRPVPDDVAGFEQPDAWGTVPGMSA